MPTEPMWAPVHPAALATIRRAFSEKASVTPAASFSISGSRPSKMAWTSPGFAFLISYSKIN